MTKLIDLTDYANFEELQKMSGLSSEELARALYYTGVTEPRTESPNKIAFLRDVKNNIEPPYSVCVTDARSLKPVNDAFGDAIGDRCIFTALAVLGKLIKYRLPDAQPYYGHGDTNYGILPCDLQTAESIRDDLHAFLAYYNTTRKTFVLGHQEKWDPQILERAERESDLVTQLYDLTKKEEFILPSIVPFYFDMASAHTDEICYNPNAIGDLLKLAEMRLLKRKVDFYEKVPELDIRGELKNLTNRMKIAYELRGE
jgi:hypothetical protein